MRALLDLHVLIRWCSDCLLLSSAQQRAPRRLSYCGIYRPVKWRTCMAVADIGWPFPRMNHEEFRVAAPAVAARDAPATYAVGMSQHALDWLHPAAATRRPGTGYANRREEAEPEERGAHNGLAVASL